MTSGNKGSGPGKAALAVALVAPAIALAAAVAIRVTGVGRDLAFDLAVMTVGRTIAWGAAVLAVMALVHALGDLKRRGLFAALALVVAGVTAGLYLVQTTAAASPADVSTNPSDPPMSLGEAGATTGACEGLTPIPSQLLSEQVSEALQKSGFSIVRASLFEVVGERQAFWFRQDYSVDVRIRPGRTDLRVVTRNGEARDRGAACRQALRLLADLQTGR